MFNLIFTGDTIDDGRRKINLILTGIGSTGYWQPLNSGDTSFSLEFSAITNPSTNNDESDVTGSTVIGRLNDLTQNSFSDSGFNFVQGTNNGVAAKNSFIAGVSNYIINASNSFITGNNNYIDNSTKNNVSIISSNSTVLTSNTTNDFVTVLSSSNSKIIGKGVSKSNRYLTSISNINLLTTANTEFVSVLTSFGTILSGDIRNSSVIGYNNYIGYNQDKPTSETYKDVYIFGSNLKPYLSAVTFSPLSGTYINDLCIEEDLRYNPGIYYITPATGFDAYLEMSKHNMTFVFNFGITGTQGVGVKNATANFMSASTHLPIGLFFVPYINNQSFSLGIEGLSGDTSNFVEEYDRWDIPTNTTSANTVFLTCFHDDFTDSAKFIRYKG